MIAGDQGRNEVYGIAMQEVPFILQIFRSGKYTIYIQTKFPDFSVNGKSLMCCLSWLPVSSSTTSRKVVRRFAYFISLLSSVSYWL